MKIILNIKEYLAILREKYLEDFVLEFLLLIIHKVRSTFLHNLIFLREYATTTIKIVLF